MNPDPGFDALWISDHLHLWNDEQGFNAALKVAHREALP